MGDPARSYVSSPLVPPVSGSDDGPIRPEMERTPSVPSWIGGFGRNSSRFPKIENFVSLASDRASSGKLFTGLLRFLALAAEDGELSNVQREIGQADQKIGKDAYDRYNDLIKEMQALEAQLKKIGG